MSNVAAIDAIKRESVQEQLKCRGEITIWKLGWNIYDVKNIIENFIRFFY